MLKEILIILSLLQLAQLQNEEDVADCGATILPFGQVCVKSTTLGTVATYSCTFAYHLNGPDTRICQDDGEWSGSEPTCELVNCGPLISPSHGQVRVTSTTFGSVANYSCDTGYNLQGPDIRICQVDGIWSGINPACDIVDCGVTTLPLGQVSVTSTTFGSVATYSCATGYELSGPDTRVCQDDGTWSGIELTCEIVDCGFTTLPNGQVSATSTIFGSIAVYSCATGYNLDGPEIRACQADGNWYGIQPTCGIVNCGAPEVPSQGVVTVADTVFASVATYTCNTGYNLNGDDTRTCQADGTWSGVEPTCEILNCRSLASPSHGQVSVASTTFDSSVTYTCDTGYNLHGPGTRKCQADGKWSGTNPTCEIVNCGSLSHPANGQVSFSASTTYNSVATYSCNNCYDLNGGSTRRCEANGQWSGSQPTCSGGGYAPFYRYWNGRDHFYTTNINEIGTATHGQAGNHGYTSEGTQCIIRSCQVSGSIPLYRYWNGYDHFYTTNANEIGVTTPGVGGHHGYTSEGTAGYCFPSQVQNTIPLYRYYRSASGDHFYTTNANEIGTTTPGHTGNYGYRSEGTQCYVHPN